MPMDPVPAWISAFSNLAPASDPSWAGAMADAVDQRVTNKLGITGVVGGPVQFTFNKAIFQTGLLAAAPSPAAPAAAQVIALAFQNAVLASTLVVPPGASLGAPSPATTWSAVIISMILPPSVAAATQALTAQLAAAPPAPEASASQYGPALFQAFSLLMGMVTGLNSIPPPAGPTPLPLPGAPVM